MNTYKTHTNPNTAAQALAIAAINGKISEDEARLAIAGVIEADDIPASVAREQRGLTERMRLDLTSLLSDMMVGRMTGTGGFKKDLDLARVAAGQEVTAYARQMLRFAVRSKLRDLRAVDSHAALADPLEQGESSFDGISAEYTNAGTLSAEETVDENRFNATLNSLQEIKGLRHVGQTKQDARHLREAYEITAPIVVPEDSSDREWLAAALEANEMLAYASLTSWLAIVTGDGRVAPNLDDRVLGMWDDFTADQAEDLAERRPGVAHKIALAAVLLMPKPSRDVLKEAVKLATLAAPGHEWELHAASLVESWVARECSPFSEFKTKSRGDEAQVAADRELAAAAWPELIARTAAFHRAPLGATEEVITRRIGRIFSSIDSANFPPQP